MQVPKAIRCLVRARGDQWEAYSLEFGLAVQAESRSAAQAKLHEMIADYVKDAIGIDRAHADELLNRRASFGIYLLYYRVKFLSVFGDGLKRGVSAYSERIGQNLAYV
ncbi:MAG: hypothetical protein EBT35_07900 [Alphaproteobacteria bacterium]|nr:hypothetical protein [Alphaproteobacteria bacterium]